MSSRDTALCITYALIAVAALLGTWSQNIAFMTQPDGGMSFLSAAMINPAAASLTIDLAFLGLAALIWMLVEARRLQIPWVWAYVVFSLLIAISVTFPLFLIARQRRLAALA